MKCLDDLLPVDTSKTKYTEIYPIPVRCTTTRVRTLRCSTPKYRSDTHPHKRSVHPSSARRPVHLLSCRCSRLLTSPTHPHALSPPLSLPAVAHHASAPPDSDFQISTSPLPRPCTNPPRGRTTREYATSATTTNPAESPREPIPCSRRGGGSLARSLAAHSDAEPSSAAEASSSPVGCRRRMRWGPRRRGAAGG